MESAGARIGTATSTNGTSFDDAPRITDGPGLHASWYERQEAVVRGLSASGTKRPFASAASKVGFRR
jgi:hypothetical protein